MAWIMHSSGPWKDHKYKERTGTPGNYSYKYGTEENNNNGSGVHTWNTTDSSGFQHPTQTVDTYANDGRAAAIRNTYVGEREGYKRNGSREAVLDTYYADRTGYQRTNNARHDLVGDDNEAKKKHVRYNDRRKQFESQTLSAMRNAVNQAKSNNKRTDGDMRDAAVARGREQYMTSRATKAASNIASAVQRNREEKKRAEYERDKLLRKSGFRR